MTTDAVDRTQLLVIGAGPGGYASAFHAADRGIRVTLVDADPKPGGECLHRGCIPSKALLHVARLIHEARDARAWGVRFAEPEIDLAALRQWKRGVTDRLGGGIVELCKRRKVRLVRARATFLDSETIELAAGDGEPGASPGRLRFEHAIVATGSQPAAPAALRLDDPRVMDSTAALELPDVPPRLLVVGGGYIGLELGSVYAALGSRVTLIELTDGLLPGVDRDLVRPLERRLGRLFEAIHLSTQVESLEPRGDGILARVRGDNASSEAVFDRVLVAVGRQPASGGLGLEHTQVKLDDRGFVRVDRQLRTSDRRIFAIGDVAGGPMLAHKASREGKVAAAVLAGEPAEFDNAAVPAVVFTDPEIAWCGLTETQAQAENRPIRVTRCPWAAAGRAQTIGRIDGLTKLVCDPAGRVLGVGVVGPGAGELIAEGVLAVETAAAARDVAESIHPHPTLSETIAEAAEAFLGQATHLYDPKR